MTVSWHYQQHITFQYQIITENADERNMDHDVFKKSEESRFQAISSLKTQIGPRTSEQKDQQIDTVSNVKFPVFVSNNDSEIKTARLLDFTASLQQALPEIDPNINRHHHVVAF